MKCLSSIRSPKILKSGWSNLVPRVGFQYDGSSGEDPGTQQIEDGQISKFFQNGGKESGYDHCQETKWSTNGKPKAVKFDVRNQKYGWMNARSMRMRWMTEKSCFSFHFMLF